MKARNLFLLCVVGVISLWGLPKPGEQYNYRVKISATSDKGQPMNMEFQFNQKIKSVDKQNQSFVVEISMKGLQQPTQKQPSSPPPPIVLQVDKNGKATVLGEKQGAAQLPIPPNMLPSFAGVLPIPSNLTKGKSFSVPVAENPKTSIVFKHLGDATYKGKRCSKISMTIPSATFSSSSPQGESKMTMKGEGTFFALPADNRILQGKITIHMETKGFAYTPEQKKVSLDSKSTIIVEIEKL